MLSLVAEKVRAWELLSDPQFGSLLGAADFYDLMLRAGHSGPEAQEAANQRGWQRLVAGMMV